jgi:hypothetical protein
VTFFASCAGDDNTRDSELLSVTQERVSSDWVRYGELWRWMIMKRKEVRRSSRGLARLFVWALAEHALSVSRVRK